MTRVVFLSCLLYSTVIFAQEFERLNFDQLYKNMTKDNDTTYVVNFWATWCGPCVKELPYFESIEKEYANKKIKVILVSLDFIDQIDTKFIPFLKVHKIQSSVVLLDAPNENEWIPKVDEQWSGAIPATLLYRGNKRAFFEQSFTKTSLFKTLDDFMNDSKN